MDYSQLPGKYIADKNSQKIGFVIDIRNITTSNEDHQKPQVRMLVKIERAFRDAITVEADVEKILKIDGYYAWLDVTKKEFFESIKNKKKISQKTQERKEIKKTELVIPKASGLSQPIIDEKKEKTTNTGIFAEGTAFKEYTMGRNTKLKTPWITIAIVGLITAILSFILYVFGIITVGNPYAMNMIIGLLGLPAGFILAFKNNTLDIMVSWRYSSYSGIIYSITYFVIGFVYMSINTIGTGRFLNTLLSLFLSCLVIGIYSILVTFSIGALLGTMIHGYLDDKR